MCSFNVPRSPILKMMCICTYRFVLILYFPTHARLRKSNFVVSLAHRWCLLLCACGRSTLCAPHYVCSFRQTRPNINYTQHQSLAGLLTIGERHRELRTQLLFYVKVLSLSSFFGVFFYRSVNFPSHPLGEKISASQSAPKPLPQCHPKRPRLRKHRRNQLPQRAPMPLRQPMPLPLRRRQAAAMISLLRS